MAFSSSSFGLASEPDWIHHLLRLPFSSQHHAPFSYGAVRLGEPVSSSPRDNLRQFEEMLHEASVACISPGWPHCTSGHIAYNIGMVG